MFSQFQYYNQPIIFKLPDYIPNLALELADEKPQKPKPPPLKKDPVLDTPDEIKKWLEQRRKRYPSKTKLPIDEASQEFSILEQKLRKKISILSGSSRRTQIKVQQMKELCKVMTESKRTKRIKENNDQQQIDSQSESEEKEQNDIQDKDKDKETILKEIAKLTKKLTENRPKEFYKKIKEGIDTKQLNKTDKQIIKKKIKELKVQLREIDPEQIEEKKVEKQEQTISTEDHTKEMIDNLEDQKEKMQVLLEESLNYRVNPANFRYKSNTLYTNMLISEIYKERQYILQAIRYIVKENFFIDKPDQEYECITSESEIQQSSEDSGKESVIDEELF